MLNKGDDAPNSSGRQEFLENLINEFVQVAMIPTIRA